MVLLLLRELCTHYASGAYRRSAVATVYTVRLTVAARVALVGAKLHRAVAWVRLHEPDHHRPRAHRATGGRHGCKPLIRSHVMPFRRKRRSPATLGGHITTRSG